MPERRKRQKDVTGEHVSCQCADTKFKELCIACAKDPSANASLAVEALRLESMTAGPTNSVNHPMKDDETINSTTANIQHCESAV